MHFVFFKDASCMVVDWWCRMHHLSNTVTECGGD